MNILFKGAVLSKRWIMPEPVTVSADLRDFVGGHPLVAETLVRRGITTVADAHAFLDPSMYVPAPPSDFPGMHTAVERIVRAIRQRERICVWGDFDVDGQTSTTILVSTLHDLGANVVYHIPVRATESHGIKVPWLQKELAKGTQLLLTCDTGIDAHEAVDYANAHGVDVVITDHHELPQTLPAACAIINPHLLVDEHPLQTLPGVGVAYKLAEALYDWVGRPDDVQQYLDLVALGIVADVAIQTGDTRYLLQRGLQVLRETPRLGLKELMRWSNVSSAHLSADDIGFSLAPRLNALGRLDDANVIVEFFTTQNLGRARILSSQLESLNARRKMLCEQVFDAAQSQVAQNPELLNDAVLVLTNSTWPSGVVGIVANRLVEQYHRPVILLTMQDDVAHGSARSVEGCHITDAIATQSDLLLNFGGHQMAAGLSLIAENIPAFRRHLSKTVREQMGVVSAPTMLVDGKIALSDVSLDLFQDLDRLSPYGSGNPTLHLLAESVKMTNQRKLGRDGRHLRLTVEDDSGASHQVVWWQWDGAALPEAAFNLVYSLHLNTFRGSANLQLVYEDFGDVVVLEQLASLPARTLNVIDYRQEPHPMTLLKPLLVQENIQVWQEAALNDEKIGHHRYELMPSSTLLVWTTPPGPDELQLVLHQVQPDLIYLFCHDSGLDSVKMFLKHLVGLVKYALRVHNGEVHISELTVHLGQRVGTIRLGLTYLATCGHIDIVLEQDAVLKIQPGGDVASSDEAQYFLQQLHLSLSETVAYRKHFKRMAVTDVENQVLAILSSDLTLPLTKK